MSALLLAADSLPIPGGHVRLPHILNRVLISLMIIFIDESGVKSFCNCVTLGAVAFLERRGESYMVGRHLVEGIKKMLRVGGELKWRGQEGRPDRGNGADKGHCMRSDTRPSTMWAKATWRPGSGDLWKARVLWS